MSKKILSVKSNVELWRLPEVIDPIRKNILNELTDEEIREKMLAEVELQAKEIKELAYKEGYENGRKEGLESSQKYVDEYISCVQSIIKAFVDPVEHLTDIVEEEIVQLSVAIARQIVRREIKMDPGQVVAVVKEALSALPSTSSNIVIYLNPSDIEIIRKIIPESITERRIKLVDDPVISRGGCKVETDTSGIDATMESRVASIAAMIMGGERSDDRQPD